MQLFEVLSFYFTLLPLQPQVELRFCLFCCNWLDVLFFFSPPEVKSELGEEGKVPFTFSVCEILHMIVSLVPQN